MSGRTSEHGPRRLNRRSPMWHLRWIAPLALTLLLVAVAVRPPTGVPDQRPNVVVIMFDDLDLPLARAMPGWDRLAARGATFDNAYVTTPLCCPSRVSFLTGQWAHSHGVISNSPPSGGYERAAELGVQRSTLAVWLDEVGYHTSLIGRYLNGHPKYTRRQIPPGWDDWQVLIGGKYLGYRLNDNGKVVRPNRYSTDELSRRVMKELNSAPRPFFLWVPTTTPHTPLEIAGRYKDADAPEGVDPGRYRLMLAGMDLLEEVLAALPEDTYLIVTSDNGFHTEPEWGKNLPYDTDTRVPLTIIGPDIAPGRFSHLVANVDLAPTIAEWTGAASPDIEGSSLVPLMEGRAVTWRDELLLEAVGDWEATRTSTDLVIRWADGRVERVAH
jgi:N-acetylglucosamine-6-sulfatase